MTNMPAPDGIRTIRCMRCGLPLWNDFSSTAPNLCRCQPVTTSGDAPEVKARRASWECHRCKRVNAPHVDQCTCEVDENGAIYFRGNKITIVYPQFDQRDLEDFSQALAIAMS